MSSTRPESDSSGGSITPLAEALRTDHPEDSRSCPHETCHGSLNVREDDTVFCTTCRCTPEGVFLPPDYDERSSSRGTTGFPSYNPYPSDGPNGVVESWSHDEYTNSNAVRLAGGYEPVYDEDEDRRPAGVGEEYTFDLSTL